MSTPMEPEAETPRAPTAPDNPDTNIPADSPVTPPDSEPHAPIQEPGSPTAIGDPAPAEPTRLL